MLRHDYPVFLFLTQRRACEIIKNDLLGFNRILETARLGGDMLKNILVPVDGSEHALKAMELAGDLAEKYNGD
jgi:hypothetical protein